MEITIQLANYGYYLKFAKYSPIPFHEFHRTTPGQFRYAPHPSQPSGRLAGACAGGFQGLGAGAGGSGALLAHVTYYLDQEYLSESPANTMTVDGGAVSSGNAAVEDWCQRNESGSAGLL